VDDHQVGELRLHRRRLRQADPIGRREARAVSRSGGPVVPGQQARAKQLQTYLGALRTGVAPEEAFRGAFGADLAVLQQELFEYVRNFTFPAVRYSFEAKLGASVSGRAEPLEDAEAHGYLGDLIARAGRKDDARTLLTGAMKANPRAVRPAVALGMLHLRDNQVDEAITALQAAISRGPGDAAAHAVLGRALYLKLAEGNTDGDVRQRAHDALTRAVELDATDARPLALLASLELQRDGGVERASAFITRALKLAPSDEQYRLMHATVLIRLKQFDQAAGILGPLMAAGSTASIRETARRVMGDSANYRLALERSANGAAAPPPDVDAVSLARGDVASTSGPSSARVILDLRPVGAGETRVLGRFTAIECPANGVVVLVDVGGQTLRVGAPAIRADRLHLLSLGCTGRGLVRSAADTAACARKVSGWREVRGCRARRDRGHRAGARRIFAVELDHAKAQNARGVAGIKNAKTAEGTGRKEMRLRVQDSASIGSTYRAT
jgi:tetratricopeptide (TPR) repeat protein